MFKRLVILCCTVLMVILFVPALTVKAAGEYEGPAVPIGQIEADAASEEPGDSSEVTSEPKLDEEVLKEFPKAENVWVTEKQKMILNANTDKGDVEGSTQRFLQLKGTAKNKKSIKLTWKTIKQADGYIIYGSKCGSKMKYVTTIKKPAAKSFTIKKLKKGTYYKYMVVAYKTTESGDVVLTTSKSVHVATTGSKKGNPSKITVKKSKISAKVGKTVKIKAKFKSPKGKKIHTHIAKFRYESFDEKIATVDKKGKVKAVSKGKTKILVYTQNGLCKTINVTVK
ncbi:MAG: Ig-like domain-containing protein [Eubacterium sp.]|nr:Ig-like domain-containing protein [Eubacterium sp.]